MVSRKLRPEDSMPQIGLMHIKGDFVFYADRKPPSTGMRAPVT